MKTKVLLMLILVVLLAGFQLAPVAAEPVLNAIVWGIDLTGDGYITAGSSLDLIAVFWEWSAYEKRLQVYADGVLTVDLTLYPFQTELIWTDTFDFGTHNAILLWYLDRENCYSLIEFDLPLESEFWLPLTTACAWHDVAVTNVTPSQTLVKQGDALPINVIVENQGNDIETLYVTTYYGSATLTPEQWKAFWSMGDVNRDGYIDETDKDLIMAAFGSEPWMWPQWNPDADINQDLYVDSGDLAIYYYYKGAGISDIWTYFISGAVIETQTVNNLSPGSSTTLVSTWDTTGVVLGNYIISAYATVVPGEFDRSNNNFGDVVVTIAPPATPEELVQELIETIETSNIPKGTKSGLNRKLEDALRLLEKGSEEGAIHKLMDFINQVEAQRGKKLTNDQADQLVEEAQGIIDLIEG